jgi:hypothetical protein
MSANMQTQVSRLVRRIDTDAARIATLEAENAELKARCEGMRAQLNGEEPMTIWGDEEERKECPR